MGTILSYFLLFKGRKFPAFWPKGKVLERIQISKYQSSARSDSILRCLKLDTSFVDKNISHAEVYFSKSLPRKKPCPTYALRLSPKSNCLILVESCDSTFQCVDVRNMDGLPINCGFCSW